MKLKFYKIGVLIIFVLIFLISYEFIKGNFKINFFNKKTNNQTIFYCEDDSYILDGTTCTKYISSKPTLLGDVNSSGNIDLLDADIIKEYLDSKRELNSIQLKAADINDDETVDIDDINILQTNLNNDKNGIGKKFICDDNYELQDDLCIKKIVKDSLEINVKSGDINQNNKFDKNDLEYLKNYLNGKDYLTNLMYKIADYNKDEKINKNDLDYLKSKKLKNIDIKDKKEIKVDSLNLDYYASVDITKNSKKKVIDTNTTVKYNFDVKTSKDLYYEWISVSDFETYEKSMCNKLNNNIRYTFDIKVKGNQNYFIMNIYEDDSCEKLVNQYKTEEYKMKSA